MPAAVISAVWKRWYEYAAWSKGDGSNVFVSQRLENFSRNAWITVTLPEINIAPENRPLEKEIPIGNHHF